MGVIRRWDAINNQNSRLFGLAGKPNHAIFELWLVKEKKGIEEVKNPWTVPDDVYARRKDFKADATL
ncbi:hypothetical protein AFLA_011163 [Aspergillus flavus NRRL3357]|nr:hypothetical protein AFLA_011163 [Aspergillus flavus NRRL3357]